MGRRREIEREMKRIAPKAVIAILIAMPVRAALAVGKYSHLESWVGRYPSVPKGSPNFFKLPEITQVLKQLLSEADYERLTKTLGVEAPIQRVDDYLAIERCRPHCCPCENALLLISLRDDAVLVVIFDAKSGEDDERATKCYSTGRQLADLSDNIKEEVLGQHIPLMSADDKLLPRNQWLNKVRCMTPLSPNRSVQRTRPEPRR